MKDQAKTQEQVTALADTDMKTLRQGIENLVAPGGVAKGIDVLRKEFELVHKGILTDTEALRLFQDQLGAMRGGGVGAASAEHALELAHKKGEAAFDEATKRIKEYGLELTPENQAAAKEYSEKWSQMTSLISAGMKKFAAGLSELGGTAVIDSVINEFKLGGFFNKLGQFLGKDGPLQNLLKDLDQAEPEWLKKIFPLAQKKPPEPEPEPGSPEAKAKAEREGKTGVNVVRYGITGPETTSYMVPKEGEDLGHGPGVGVQQTSGTARIYHLPGTPGGAPEGEGVISDAERERRKRLQATTTGCEYHYDIMHPEEYEGKPKGPPAPTTAKLPPAFEGAKGRGDWTSLFSGLTDKTWDRIKTIAEWGGIGAVLGGGRGGIPGAIIGGLGGAALGYEQSKPAGATPGSEFRGAFGSPDWWKPVTGQEGGLPPKPPQGAFTPASQTGASPQAIDAAPINSAIEATGSSIQSKSDAIPSAIDGVASAISQAISKIASAAGSTSTPGPAVESPGVTATPSVVSTPTTPTTPTPAGAWRGGMIGDISGFADGGIIRFDDGGSTDNQPPSGFTSHVTQTTGPTTTTVKGPASGGMPGKSWPGPQKDNLASKAIGFALDTARDYGIGKLGDKAIGLGLRGAGQGAINLGSKALGYGLGYLAKGVPGPIGTLIGMTQETGILPGEYPGTGAAHQQDLEAGIPIHWEGGPIPGFAYGGGFGGGFGGISFNSGANLGGGFPAYQSQFSAQNPPRGGAGPNPAAIAGLMASLGDKYGPYNAVNGAWVNTPNGIMPAYAAADMAFSGFADGGIIGFDDGGSATAAATKDNITVNRGNFGGAASGSSSVASPSGLSDLLPPGDFQRQLKESEKAAKKRDEDYDAEQKKRQAQQQPQKSDDPRVRQAQQQPQKSDDPRVRRAAQLKALKLAEAQAKWKEKLDQKRRALQEALSKAVDASRKASFKHSSMYMAKYGVPGQQQVRRLEAQLRQLDEEEKQGGPMGAQQRAEEQQEREKRYIETGMWQDDGGSTDKLAGALATKAAPPSAPAPAFHASPKQILGFWGGGVLPGFAQGSVSGPGSGTSDSILARLSNGEFVMKAAAVRAYGSGFMSAINNMQIPAPKYAMGGMVPISAIPRFAAGGAVERQTTLNLHIGDQSFNGLKAPEAVAQQLKTYALDQATTSTGRKPSWVG